MDIQTQDGILLRNIPDGTPDEAIKARIAKIRAESPAPPASTESPTSLRNLAGAAVEPILHLATGAVAGPVSGLAGIGTGLINAGKSALGFPEGPKAADVVNATADMMTYRPRTKGGMDATDFITYPLRKYAESSELAGGKTTDITGSPMLGAEVDAVLQALPAIAGARAAPSGAPALPLLDKAIALPGKVAAATGRVAYRTIEPALPSGPEAILNRYQQGLAGDARSKIIEALTNAKEIVPGSSPTAGEAIGAIPEATQLAAHQKVVSRTQGPAADFAAREAEQEAARARAIGGVAKTRKDLEAAIAERAQNANENYGAVSGDRVSSKSDVELMQEAIANRAASKAEALRDEGRFSTTAAQAENKAQNFVPVPGMPRVAGRITEFPERAAEATQAATETKGIAGQRLKEQQFLESTMERLQETVGLDNRSLASLLDRPSMRAAVQDAIASAQETGGYFPTKPGEKFSVANLQRIKESLDAGIRAANAAADAGKRPELSPAELEGTRNAFVQWLSNKSPGWRDARQQFAADSRPINEMQVGQYLEDKLKSPLNPDVERAGVFAQAVKDAPGTIKRSTGAPMYDELSQVLNPKQEGVVNAVLADLSRKAQSESTARGTNLQGGTSIAGNAEHLPHLLSRPAMLTNFVMRAFGDTADVKINRLAGERYLDPQALADALKGKPLQERLLIEELMRRRNQMATGGAVAAGEH